jgi:hypothetical protein
MLAALVAAPLLTLVASIVQSAPAGHDTAAELASIAAHPTRYQVAGLLGFASMLLFVPGLLAFARLVRPARPRWADIGLGLSMTGLLALTSLMGSGPLSQALAQASDRSAMVRVTDAYEGLPLTNAWVLLMLVGWLLGPLVLGLGLWRTGGPWAVPALLAAGLVAQFLDEDPRVLALGFALTAAGLVVAAVSGWRELSRRATTAAPAVDAQPTGRAPRTSRSSGEPLS